MNDEKGLTRLLALGVACACAKAWVKRQLPCITFSLAVLTVVEILTTTLLVYVLITTSTADTARPSMPVSSRSSATTARSLSY